MKNTLWKILILVQLTAFVEEMKRKRKIFWRIYKEFCFTKKIAINSLCVLERCAQHFTKVVPNYYMPSYTIFLRLNKKFIGL